MNRDAKGRFVKQAKSRAPKAAPDIALVTVALTRSDGSITIDDEFSTPAETCYMLWCASEIVKDRLDDRHETE